MPASHRLVQIGAPAHPDGTAPVVDLDPSVPDADWVEVNGQEKVTGRCSLWWRNPPRLPGHRLGLIGQYASDHPDTGRRLLEKSCQELRRHGATMAVGPMDGSTWRSYRFVTWSRGDAPFFLEPSHPPSWPAEFTADGFRPLATYSSSEDCHLDREDDASVRAAARMADLGVQLRPLALDRFDEELRSVHPVITAAFQEAFLYQPISMETFVAQYEAIRPSLHPALAFMAMHEDRPVGFIFTVPDHASPSAGKPADTAIIKTLAVLPGRRFAGLGIHLTAASRRAAHDLGYRRIIHAMMHDSNSSRCIRREFTGTFRRYTLFAKLL